MKKFKSAFTILFTLSLTLLALSCIVQFDVRASEQILFEEDFESYAVGSFPSSSWDLLFNGAGDAYQVIVDDASVSRNKSLQLLARPGWAADASRPINPDLTVIGYEGYVMVEEVEGLLEPCGRLGFSKKEPYGASWYAQVNFNYDGSISVANPVEPRVLVLQSYAADTWYKVKVILDREKNTYSAWIDDVLRAENISFSYIDPYDYNYFALSANMEAHGKIHFDDVKLFAIYDVNPKLVLEPTSGIAATTLVGSGFVPNSEMSVTWNGTAIHTVPNPLVTDGYGNFTAIISVLNQTVSGSYYVRAIDELGNEANATFEVVSTVPTSTLDDNSTTKSDDDHELESTDREKPANEQEESAPEILLSSLLLMAPTVLAITVIYKRKTPTKPKES